MAKLTPARKQYLDIKREVPNCLLFFRMGDFYELFDEDAVIAARELDITLTARQHSKDSAPIPMAGVPHHAVEGYVARLIEKGYHVAVCDQTSEPDGRGIVEREVTRVLTPGTLMEPSLLSDDQPNYLLALLPVGSPKDLKWQMAGIAYVDISTGEFAATQLEGENAAVLVLEELARLQPREVLIPELWAKHGVSLPEGIHLTTVQDWTFEHSTAEQAIKAQFHVHTLESYGLHNKPHATRACGAILQYLRTTQKNSLAQLSKVTLYSTDQFMVLDQFTRRNLELTQTIRAGTTQGSVLGVLDRTQTAMGARQLRAWMNQPLLDINRLNARLNAVEALTQDEATRQALKAALQHIGDIERLVNRLLIGKANPRELVQLAKSLQAVPRLRDEIKPYRALESLHGRLEPCEEVVDIISRALVDEPPAVMNDVGTIRAGFSPELDDILSNSAHARQWIAELEPKERRRTGIASLKVGFNKVFGYYIEITQANADRVPSDYIRKQTLANAERYITPDLKEYESLVLNAEEEILACEKRIFAELCAHLAQYAEPMLRTAQAVALLDVFLSLATVAVHEGYTRPTLTENSDTLIIKGGRHPVVEKYLKDGARYTPNDTTFSATSRVHIITGPNMSGKSTYIRQVAVITLMAQIGSFVPADEATIGLVDRIFARIGAQDEIHAGQSTFMVEMVETARLLNGSTSRSLVVLDEIGRGTSTYDGIAIARAVIEYLHNHPRLNCRTLFATHYHELTELPNILPRTDNYRVAVAEQGEDVIFLHRVVAGGADRSYGVHVAQLAGLPRPVVERARQLLEHLETKGGDFKRAPKPAEAPPAKQQLTLFSATTHPVVDALKSLDVDALSPIEALTRLYELKRMAQE
jgi:DNA mismatch repair protein MutS